MNNKQTKYDNGKLTHATTKKKCSSLKSRKPLSDYLESHPILFVVCAIFVLMIVACFVWIMLRWLQAHLRSMDIHWFSMDAGLFNWFSLFVSYAGAIATVVLGILTVRLTIKQDRSNDYAAISELQLDNFLICDLWHEYTPSNFECDRGRRFVLTFDVKGLKAYYKIRSIKLSWKPAQEDTTRYRPLENQEVLCQSTFETKVMAHFDEFPDGSSRDSIYYFFRLNLYRPEMMPPGEKRRWLQVHIKLDYADNKMESDVYCEYLLEYAGIKAGTVRPKPVDRQLRISSYPKKASSGNDSANRSGKDLCSQ